MLGEVVTRIDVEVLGGHYMTVVGAVSQVSADCARQGRTAGHCQRTALAKVILDVDDDQRAHATHGIAAGPDSVSLTLRLGRIGKVNAATFASRSSSNYSPDTCPDSSLTPLTSLSP